MNRSNNRIILVTGGKQGIGMACVKKFLEDESNHVIVSDLEPIDLSVFNDDEQERLMYKYLDVTKQDNWIELVDELEGQFGRLDVLINNAGIIGTKLKWPATDLEETSYDSWQKVHQVNLDGIFLGCKSAMTLLAKSGNASIINIGSRSALFARYDRMAYGSSKAALSNLNKSVAVYAMKKNHQVRCNMVVPSTILTSAWEPLVGNINSPDPQVVTKFTKHIPMKRFGLPEEVANVVYFLSSDQASYITGTEIIVDGGASAADALRS